MADLRLVHLARLVYPDRAPTPAPATSEPRKYSPQALALAALYNFPPLPDLDKIARDDVDSEEDFLCSPDEYTGGIIMAGRRIRNILPQPMKPRTSRFDPMPEVPKPIPGWTDGLNAWRASVYTNTRLPADPTFPTPAPRTKVRMSRRAMKTSYLEEQPIDPTPDLYEKFNECMALRADSRISTSPNSPASIKRERSLLPAGLEEKLLVPNIKLKVRSGSSAPLSLSSRASTTSSSSCRTPLSSSNPLTPLRATHLQTQPMRPWDADRIFVYEPMAQPVRVKRTRERRSVNGEDVWVDVESKAPPIKLFLFPSATPMAPPPPGVLRPT